MTGLRWAAFAFLTGVVLPGYHCYAQQVSVSPGQSSAGQKPTFVFHCGSQSGKDIKTPGLAGNTPPELCQPLVPERAQKTESRSETAAGTGPERYGTWPDGNPSLGIHLLCSSSMRENLVRLAASMNPPEANPCAEIH
jgi:hypothetical protein